MVLMYPFVPLGLSGDGMLRPNSITPLAASLGAGACSLYVIAGGL